MPKQELPTGFWFSEPKIRNHHIPRTLDSAALHPHATHQSVHLHATPHSLTSKAQTPAPWASTHRRELHDDLVERFRRLDAVLGDVLRHLGRHDLVQSPLPTSRGRQHAGQTAGGCVGRRGRRAQVAHTSQRYRRCLCRRSLLSLVDMRQICGSRFPAYLPHSLPHHSRVHQWNRRWYGRSVFPRSGQRTVCAPISEPATHDSPFHIFLGLTTRPSSNERASVGMASLVATSAGAGYRLGSGGGLSADTGRQCGAPQATCGGGSRNSARIRDATRFHRLASDSLVAVRPRRRGASSGGGGQRRTAGMAPATDVMCTHTRGRKR